MKYEYKSQYVMQVEKLQDAKCNVMSPQKAKAKAES